MIITVTLNPAIDKTVEAPHFHVGGHVRVKVKGSVPAGKGINVARGLAVLGIRCNACALMGKNEQPLYRELLKKQGIEPHFITVPGNTRTNTTVLDPADRTTTHLREEGFQASSHLIARVRRTLGEMVGTNLGGTEMVTVVFCGSLPPGVSPDDFLTLTARCSNLGARVVIDTSGQALHEIVRERVAHTIKPNLQELRQCLEEDVSEEEAPDAAKDLLGHTERILLTLSGKGAYLITEEFTCGLSCPVSREELRNTVGAGDAFLAGWLAGCERAGGDLTTALEWAVATGSASVRTDTAVGYTRNDVEELRRQVEEI